ncbi:MAG: tetratricopeptide repeat protein [Bryobacterales bacterium]|nr:tetratricopeptide repeat protein [Bryobacterales bacterium]
MRVPFCIAACLALCAAAAGQTLQRAEALWSARDYRGANDAFRALVAAYPDNPDYRVRWGRLLLERFNKADAAALFQEALERNKEHAGALLGLALAASDSFERKAVELAERALKADPRLVEARELLARLALEENDPRKAAGQAAEALRIAPGSVQAKAILATIEWLQDKTPSEDPRHAKAYETAGYFFILNRRYEEGIGFYRKAIGLDPELWSARSQLGINLMRLGAEAEARQHLEKCYHNGYANDATVNTLRLLDSYKNYVTFKTGNTVLKLHRKEAEVLRPYFEGELKRAIAAFEKKYAFQLERPVQVEVYPEHEDFAVRTLGMPGLGALGVTFGYVVAMDSPSGRKPGSFHWASTLWHELSHVFTLSATRHRVPRWFSEGMAVYEETAVSPEWGDRLDPEVIQAIRDRKLLPVAQLDRGFVRPSYPAQIGVSYFQAGRICSYIAKEWGYGKLLDMLRDFGAGADTPAAVEKNLGLKPEEFDRRFLAWIEAENRSLAAGFEDWRKRLKQVAEYARAGDHDEVIKAGTAIRDIFPDYVEAANVYEFLAEAYLAKQDKASAAAELERYAKRGGRSPAALKKLATLLEESGRTKEAAAALERINYIHPLDEELHRRLGGLWMSQGNLPGAIREFEAVIALKPADTAAAHFNLARALRAADRVERAKDELLLALEAAPGYRPAQKMLLELSRE